MNTDLSIFHLVKEASFVVSICHVDTANRLGVIMDFYFHQT